MVRFTFCVYYVSTKEKACCCILLMHYCHVCYRIWSKKVSNLKIYQWFCSHCHFYSLICAPYRYRCVPKTTFFSLCSGQIAVVNTTSAGFVAFFLYSQVWKNLTLVTLSFSVMKKMANSKWVCLRDYYWLNTNTRLGSRR